MARNKPVAADHDAPPITQILARFVAAHPSRGWIDPEFADTVVNAREVTELRRKIVATVDDQIDEASVDVTAILTSGRREHVFVEHAIGSLQRPMSDAQLEAKFKALSEPVIGDGKTKALIAAAWKINEAADVRALTAIARP